MSIFCITGFSKTSTELTERVLLASGMSTHLPLERDPAINLVRWHERVTSAQQQRRSTDSETFENPSQPSRLWQQLAIDLMVANMNSAHWGWAHAGAVQWLEFWSQLEPEIRFVLVCEDRHSLICRLVEEGQTPESMSGHLALWAQNHQEMLRFHLRNPAKSILVWDEQVRTQPTTLIQRIEESWQTRFDASLATAVALEQPAALLQHIAVQILSEHAHTAPLDHELQALIGPAPCLSASEKIDTADLIELYGQLKDRINLQAQVQQAQRNTEDAHLLLEQARVQSQTTLEQEKAQWHKQLHEAQEEFKFESAAKQDALNKLATEQKTSAALKKQKDELSAAQQESSAKSKDLQEESDLLLAQLHQVQEELEKYYLQHKERQIEVQALQDRWLRAVQSHPELLDFEDLEILSESKTELTAHWRINQLQVEGVMKGPFDFNTLIENGVAGLVFTKNAKGLSPIHRWPLIAAKDKQLTVIPVKGQDDPKKRSATILQLSTSDWHLVQLLTDKLIKALGSKAMAKQIGHGQALLEGLKAQRQILEKIPTMLRFDAIQLVGQQNTDRKSVIGLRLKRADLKGLRSDPFEFQLQLNLTAGSTMSSAHLIFEEKTVGNPFENWKQNAKSSAGQAVMALHLGPKGWNSQTWHALSPLDQQWLQNTIRLLPYMLNTLQDQGVKLEKGWAIWVQAATELVIWSKLSVDLPQPAITAEAPTPTKLQSPNAAPVPPKAPRKPRPIKVKPVKPSATVKSATQVPNKLIPAKSKAAKSAVTSKAATKVSQRPSPVKSQSAKPAIKVKVASKSKRRTA